MSPIIYTPHDCDLPNPQGIGTQNGDETLWLCPECDNVWALEDNLVKPLWILEHTPRRAAIVTANCNPHTAPAITPTTVTPDMVELVRDTYEDHMSVIPNDGAEPLGWCGECETGIYGPHTIQAHAQEIAAEVLQDALDEACDTRE